MRFFIAYRFCSLWFWHGIPSWKITFIAFIRHVFWF